jgi:hypothetical protein
MTDGEEAIMLSAGLELVLGAVATETEGASATTGVWVVSIGLIALLLFVAMLFSIAWRRTWRWDDPKGMGSRLRGLGLPSGSTRSVIALLVVGGFVLFAFFGGAVVGDQERFAAILGAWITLTGAVSGFYFGARTGQTLGSSIAGTGSTPTFSSGTDAPPTAPAADGSVYLSTLGRAYVRRAGAWVDAGLSLPGAATSMSHEIGVDLAAAAPVVTSATITAEAYVVAENAHGDHYRLARYDGTGWVWEGAAFPKV